MQQLKLSYSELESSILGISVWRSEADTLAPLKELKRLIQEKQCDLIRLRVPSGLDEINTLLTELGHHYYHSGTICVFKTDMKTLSQGPSFVNQEVKYRLCGPKDHELLTQLINCTWGNYPIGYYRSPEIGSKLTKELEVSCLSAFYCQNYTGAVNNQKIWILELENQAVGFVSAQLEEESINSTIAGVHPDFQHIGLFQDIVSWIKKQCIDESKRWFVTGSRVENRASWNTFLKAGLTPYRFDQVYHIEPVLSAKKKESNQ